MLVDCLVGLGVAGVTLRSYVTLRFAEVARLTGGQVVEVDVGIGRCGIVGANFLAACVGYLGLTLEDIL